MKEVVVGGIVVSLTGILGLSLAVTVLTVSIVCVLLAIEMVETD